jgi:acid stress-induced BolA-like protein IbaG/YrbA
MPTPQDIKDWIEGNLPGAEAEVSGDGRHFEATVVCAGFAGKSRVQQQQMVYGALGDKMKAEIHALSMRTLTPEPTAADESH